jgi:hypothetical protein
MLKRLLLLLGTGMLMLGSTHQAYAISFIDSPSASCTRVRGNECVINWNYISVTASPNYMIYLRIKIGQGSAQNIVLNVYGFFQTSMYIDHTQLGAGFPVKCGPPTPPPSSCTPPDNYDCVTLGSAYSYTITAKDSSNLKSANYGTVYCPPGF